MNTLIRLAVLHACAAAAGAASHPHIDERATTLEFRPRSVVLSLAVGGISEPLVGHVRAQWLDPFDRIVATGAAKENLHPGQNSVVLAMPSPTAKLAADRHSDLVWHRIRWYVRIPAQGISSKGVLAVSELKSNLFTLQVLTPSEAAGLRGIPVLVRAVHPVSERPVAGVAVQASFKRSKGSEITAVTDSSGLARVTLHPPAVASDDESDDENIEIRARIGEFEQVATHAAEIDRHAEIRISTDKAIYQPGQTVRIRGIAMGPDGHVLPATTVQIAISAERRRKLMDTTTTSSRYGIIAAEWTLPDNAETGRYSVEATIREGLFQGSRGWISVDVSRYELPHFTLQVTTDRPWYLPGQPAVVSVGASYLFGKPVHKGKVVITERPRPRWDAKRRESEQPEVQSGRTSLAAGRAEIRFTPRTPFGEAGYSAEIREYTVKVTDTSGRTEEQTFSLTLSSEALRVELLGANRLSTQLPMPLYIRTSYPDGKACAAQVRVQLRSDGRSIEIGTVHTGPSGVASFDDFSLALSSSDDYELTALASDGQGGTGHSSVSVDRNESGIRVIPTRHLYRAGEPVTLRIRSVKDSDVVYIAALRGTAVLDFQLVEIRGRAALITFPFREDFKGKIAFQVHRRATTFDRGIEDALDETAVFFQVKPALNVHVKTDQTQYRPGGLVRAEVTLAGGDGKPITGAVGFTVIDKAVEQRANSIRDGRFWSTSRRRYDGLAAGWPTDQGSELAAAAAAAEHQTNYLVLFPSLFVFRTAELYRERVNRDMAPLRAALDRWGKAGKPYPTHTGGLQAVLSGYGVKTGALRDPWGTTYNLRIATEHEWMRIEARSAGPDREFDTSDDLSVIQLSWRWFDRASRRIANVLRLAAVFPRTEQEFRELMRPSELAALLKDPAGNPLTVRVTTTKLAVSDTNVYEYDEYATRPPARGTAVAQLIEVPVVTLLSKQAGERGRTGEFTLASFTGPPTSDVMARLLKKPRVSAIANRSYRGGVRGTVVDFTEETIPNALIEATSTVSKVVYSTRTDSEGRFVAFLPPGSWTVRVSSPGFMLFAATGVPVVQGILTGLNVQLQLGSVSELIAVQAEPAPLMTSSAMVAAMFKKAPPPPPAAPPGGVVRQYFPETLVWLPLLETAGDGRVPVDFKLADNITTWSLKAVGSTTEGEIETVSTEVRSFLPLFIDYDPPSTLTAGDEITLTAQTRNYLEQEQTVSVLAQGVDGITVSSAAQSSLRVAAGDTSTIAFRVAAGRPSRRAASRISIKTGDHVQDAIERRIQVRPDGRRVQQVTNTLTRGRAVLSAAIPGSAVPGTVTAKLRVYPSIIAHVFESRDAILERPWGCGEQTVSSTYPNLLVLDYLAGTATQDEAVRNRATRYLQSGYNRLLGYQTASGGFTYFGSGEADPALTAYAIEFLRAASSRIHVDGDTVAKAVSWLWSTQNPEGAWPTRRGGGVQETVTIAAVLAKESNEKDARLQRAISWVLKNTAKDDSYARAGLVRIYAALGSQADLASTARELVSLATRNDSGGFSWRVQATTPYYGWGRAGDVETTALAVASLRIARSAGVEDVEPAIRGGAGWLLQMKDENGTWFSSHATIRTLQALLGMGMVQRTAQPSISVSVNGRALEQISFSDPAKATEIDLGAHMKTGANTIELAGSDVEYGTASLGTEWYVPWSEPVTETAPLAVSVWFDRTVAVVGDLITCSLEAIRRADGHFGMMVAEVGLPPGSDVDRTSLDKAIRESKAGIWRYEVQPDRVVLYLWSGSSGPIRIRFPFRTRYAMRAKNSPSVLWDYYNPDARQVVAPQLFEIHEEVSSARQ